MRKLILVTTLGVVCALTGYVFAAYAPAGGAARDGTRVQVQLLPPRQWGFSTAPVGLTVCAGLDGPASCRTDIMGQVRRLGVVQVTRWRP